MFMLCRQWKQDALPPTRVEKADGWLESRRADVESSGAVALDYDWWRRSTLLPAFLATACWADHVMDDLAGHVAVCCVRSCMLDWVRAEALLTGTDRLRAAVLAAWRAGHSSKESLAPHLRRGLMHRVCGRGPGHTPRHTAAACAAREGASNGAGAWRMGFGLGFRLLRCLPVHPHAWAPMSW